MRSVADKIDDAVHVYSFGMTDVLDCAHGLGFNSGRDFVDHHGDHPLVARLMAIDEDRYLEVLEEHPVFVLMRATGCGDLASELLKLNWIAVNGEYAAWFLWEGFLDGVRSTRDESKSGEAESFGLV